MSQRRDARFAKGLAATFLLLLGAAAWAAGEKTFLIKQGGHGDSDLLGLKHLQIRTRVDRKVTFKALFTSNVPYLTQAPSNQGDWCKLMGITTNQIHRNSIRLGWRWVPADAKVELGFYGYIKGTRISQEIAKVPLNAWANVELRMWNDGLSVKVNGVPVVRNQSLGLSKLLPTMVWVLETAYFGGDETAPHDMNIQVKDIAVQ
ncbi:MAG: hypothetical protein HYZ53_14335 [Planctomycetes bacterium]|nr:hypothetical protein [Planctomycetota bacterium]